MKFFKKERLSNPIKLNGHAILWEPVSRDSGVRQFDETKDQATITALEEMANARRMGVVIISSEIYESLKKNQRRPGSTASPNPAGAFGPQGPVRAFNREAVLITPKETSPPPSPASPAVVESAPVQTKTTRAVVSPAPSTESAATVAAPKPITRTRASKSVVESPPSE